MTRKAASLELQDLTKGEEDGLKQLVRRALPAAAVKAGALAIANGLDAAGKARSSGDKVSKGIRMMIVAQ